MLRSHGHRACLIVVACLATALGATPLARAHQDHNKDATRCDTWQRDGHPGGHEHESGSDEPGESIPLDELPAHTEIHGQSGHYVTRSDAGYVEIVGGQSYRGPDPEGRSFPGQGGYAQGEVDVAPGAPDADFNVAAFGPDHDHLPSDGAVVPWAQAAYGRACVNVAGTQIAHQTREP